jgi:hypothetical protein
MTRPERIILHQTRSGAEFSPWQLPVAVFAPAASATFDFDKLLHRAINAEPDDDLEDYAIDPVIDFPLCESPSLPPVASPIPLTPPSLPTPSTSTSVNTIVPSRHAPPKPGTKEMAYRKAKGKAREKLKAQQRRDAASYGDFAVKPRLVNKHIRKPGPLIRTSIDAGNMPHASTAYLGMKDSGGACKVFQLDELVGGGSKYGFELRKWDGRWVTNPIYPCHLIDAHRA